MVNSSLGRAAINTNKGLNKIAPIPAFFDGKSIVLVNSQVKRCQPSQGSDGAFNSGKGLLAARDHSPVLCTPRETEFQLRCVASVYAFSCTDSWADALT